MIDIKIHEDTVSRAIKLLVTNAQYGDNWREVLTGLNDLLAEVKRLHERVATLESLMEYMADEEKVIE